MVERLKTIGVDCLLRGYGGVVVGRSAGALALCRKCIVTCRSNGKAEIIDGLGLADLTLKAHYSLEKDHALEKLSGCGKIYAVPEGSAIIYDNGVCSFIGEVFLFENGLKQTL